LITNYVTSGKIAFILLVAGTIALIVILVLKRISCPTTSQYEGDSTYMNQGLKAAPLRGIVGYTSHSWGFFFTSSDRL
jgi:hypothetical protein